MTYAAYKCDLRRMQPSVWETAMGWLEVCIWNSDGKFWSFYRLQNEQIFFRVISFISFILAKYN